MIQRLRGTVRGKTIEVDGEFALQDGDQVEISVHVVHSSQAGEPWGEGLKRCAGALAGVPGLDEDLEEILRARIPPLRV